LPGLLERIAGQAQILFHRHGGEDHAVFGGVSDLVAGPGMARERAEHHVIQVDVARAQFDQTHDGTQQCGLASPVAPHDAHGAAPFKTAIDIAQDPVSCKVDIDAG